MFIPLYFPKRISQYTEVQYMYGMSVTDGGVYGVNLYHTPIDTYRGAHFTILTVVIATSMGDSGC